MSGITITNEMIADLAAQKLADEIAGQFSILAVFKEKLREDGHAALNKHLDEIVRVKSR